jgi:bis(5'-nucleosyl)-tetraphosphatase (symmetrical)
VKHTYIIGDVQGCFDSLCALLDRIEFNPKSDTLVFCGDLVNRGPKSKQVLDFCMRHPDAVQSVLGNHDIYLLARLFDATRIKDDDTLKEVVNSADASVYRDWIRHRPLFIQQDGFVAVHAGIHPDWSVAEWPRKAKRIEDVLRSNEAEEFLKFHFSQKFLAPPKDPKDAWAGLSFDLRVFTTIRTIHKKDRSLSRFTGEYAEIPADEAAWFDALRFASSTATHVFFGHWAALDFRPTPRATGLDSGCVWGRKLTCIRWSDRQVFQVKTVEKASQLGHD